MIGEKYRQLKIVFYGRYSTRNKCMWNALKCQIIILPDIINKFYWEHVAHTRTFKKQNAYYQIQNRFILK